MAPELRELGERRLWCAALALMLNDALGYWQSTARDTKAEQAFDDLLRCGPMVRHVCEFTGHDPEWICQGFIRWCESMA
jgi:hypothetical protein